MLVPLWPIGCRFAVAICGKCGGSGEREREGRACFFIWGGGFVCAWCVKVWVWVEGLGVDIDRLLNNLSGLNCPLCSCLAEVRLRRFFVSIVFLLLLRFALHVSISSTATSCLPITSSISIIQCSISCTLDSGELIMRCKKEKPRCKCRVLDSFQMSSSE